MGVISSKPITISSQDRSYVGLKSVKVEAFPTKEIKDGASFTYLNYDISIGRDKYRLEKVNLINLG